MKTLVNASNRSPVVKDYLLKDPERWQWSVDWLRSKMKNTGQVLISTQHKGPCIYEVSRILDPHCPQLGLFYNAKFMQPP